MGFSLKNAVKSVTKAAGQVAKVAVAPVAVATAGARVAVGARGAANKVIDKTALNKKVGTAEKKVATYGGYAVDAAAVAIGGAAIAPSLASGASAVGGGILKAGVAVRSAFGAAGQSVGSLVKNFSNSLTHAKATGPAPVEDKASAVEDWSQQARKVAAQLKTVGGKLNDATGGALYKQGNAMRNGALGRLKDAAQQTLGGVTIQNGPTPGNPLVESSASAGMSPLVLLALGLAAVFLAPVLARKLK